MKNTSIIALFISTLLLQSNAFSYSEKDIKNYLEGGLNLAEKNYYESIPSLESLYQHNKDKNVATKLIHAYLMTDNFIKGRNIIKEQNSLGNEFDWVINASFFMGAGDLESLTNSIIKNKEVFDNIDSINQLFDAANSPQSNINIIELIENIKEKDQRFYHIMQGFYETKKRSYKEALKHFKTALNLEKSIFIKSMVFLIEPSYENILKPWEITLLVKNDFNNEIITNVIKILNQKGNFEEYLNALYTWGNDQDVSAKNVLSIGIILQEHNRNEEAIEFISKSLNMNSISMHNYYNAKYFLAKSYFALNNIEKTIHYGEQVTNGSFILPSMKLLHQATSTDDDTTFKHFKKLIVHNTKYKPEIAANFYALHQDDTNSIEKLEMFKEKTFNNDEKHYYALHLSLLKLNEKAVSVLKELIQEVQTNADFFNSLGYLLATELNQYDEGLVYIKKAFDISPTNIDINDSLAWIYFLKGEMKKALQTFDNYTKKEDIYNSDEIVYHYIQILIKNNQKDNAAKVLTKGLKKFPQSNYLLEIINSGALN